MHYWSNYSHQSGNYIAKKFVETLKIASVITIQWSYSEQFLCVGFQSGLLICEEDIQSCVCVCVCVFVFTRRDILREQCYKKTD